MTSLNVHVGQYDAIRFQSSSVKSATSASTNACSAMRSSMGLNIWVMEKSFLG